MVRTSANCGSSPPNSCSKKNRLDEIRDEMFCNSDSFLPATGSRHVSSSPGQFRAMLHPSKSDCHPQSDLHDYRHSSNSPNARRGNILSSSYSACSRLLSPSNPAGLGLVSQTPGMYSHKDQPFTPKQPFRSSTHQYVPAGPSERHSSGMKSSMRNFSKMVCQKLEEVASTTYNEISDNLIQEFSQIDTRTDQKNIRRRVYDVLNVLNSMGIIEKDKRQIRWVGFPVELGANNAQAYESERTALELQILEKKKSLQVYLQRYVALNRLIQRNKGYEFHGAPPPHSHSHSHSHSNPHLSSGHGCPSNSPGSPDTQDKLALPFILISAPKECRIDCEMVEDRTQYFFEFDMPFTIHEDMEVLRLLNLDKVTRLELSSYLPPVMAKFYPESLVLYS